MFRLRTILILVLVACFIYWLGPDERKRRVKDRAREVWVALVVSVILYWIYMLSLVIWRYWERE